MIDAGRAGTVINGGATLSKVGSFALPKDFKES